MGAGVGSWAPGVGQICGFLGWGGAVGSREFMRVGWGWGKNAGMKYLLIIYGNKEKWDSFSAEEMAEGIAKHEAFNQKYYGTGELVGGYGLEDAARAKVVLAKDGAPAVTDGPYIEAKEYMASFWLVDVENEQRALEIAADMPYADVQPVEVWGAPHESNPG
jgi:hypothetical protein